MVVEGPESTDLMGEHATLTQRISLKSVVGKEFMINLSKLKNIGVSSTKPGSRTVIFIKTLHMVTIANFEFTISKLELSSMNFGSSTLTPPSCFWSHDLKLSNIDQ